MRLIEHKNNTPWWHAKNGEATANQVSEFADVFQRSDASAQMVAVTEGDNWISADHIRHVMAATRAEGAVTVWVSNGVFSQCVWRKSK